MNNSKTNGLNKDNNEIKNPLWISKILDLAKSKKGKPKGSRLPVKNYTNEDNFNS